jgi:plastocyanin
MFLNRLQLRLLGLSCALLWATQAGAASLQVQLQDQQGQPLANTVLSLQGPQGGEARPMPAVMDQVQKQFLPAVLAVRSGTQVSFPNRDDIRHQVYSFSPAKRFELRLYKGTPSAPVLFDKPGVVVLGCNIHDWMVGYIYITDDPWFAVSDEAGKLHIDGLPAGRYQVTLWHPQMVDLLPQAGADIDVPAAGLQLSLPVPVVSAAAATTPEVPVSAFGDAFKKAINEDR